MIFLWIFSALLCSSASAEKRGPYYIQFNTEPPEYIWNESKSTLGSTTDPARASAFYEVDAEKTKGSILLQLESKQTMYINYRTHTLTLKKLGKRQTSYFNFVVKEDLFYQGYKSLEAHAVPDNYLSVNKNSEIVLLKSPKQEIEQRRVSLKLLTERPLATEAITTEAMTTVASVTEATTIEEIVKGGSEWDKCSKKCGKGVQKTATNTRFCNLKKCPKTNEPTATTTCSATCGGGQILFRRCTFCPLVHKACNTQPCPVWGEWLDWGPCENCHQYRRRECKKSEDCKGLNIDSQTCDSGDCGFIKQYKWNSCSVTCGEGTMTGTQINCPKPARGRGRGSRGNKKPTCDQKTIPCNLQSCEEDLYVEETILEIIYSIGECSVTCGIGERTLTPTNCNAEENPVSCVTKTEKCGLQECDTEDEAPQKPPVPVTYKWTECPVCGPGTRTGTPTNCDDPTIDPCVEKIEDCNKDACPVPVEYTWTECPVCGPGTRTGTPTNCDVPTIGPCEKKEEDCNNDPCPVPVEYIWTECPVCGPGTRTGTPTNCDVPTIEPCVEKIEDCNKDACPVPVEYTWTECPVCGPGTRTGTPTNCDVPTIGSCVEKIEDCNKDACPVPVEYTWTECPVCGPGTRTGTPSNCDVPTIGPCVKKVEECNKDACPVPVEYTWTECPVCGPGTRTGTPTNCDVPTIGPCEKKEENCNNDPCPVPIEYTWSDCSVTCGPGIKIGKPTNCDVPIIGECEEKTDLCFNGICSEDGWSKCSKTCGTGSQFRRKDCEEDEEPCDIEWQDCNKFDCPKDTSCVGEETMLRFNHTASCCALPQNINECGLTVNIHALEQGRGFTRRVIGGVAAKLGYWPWMAALSIEWAPGKKATCGASIISNRWLVTAAHCVIGQKAEVITAIMGTVDISGKPSLSDVHKQEIKVEEIIIHEGYVNLGNDIAVLKLAADITFNEYVSPICLPGGEVPKNDTMCAVAGWGIARVEDIQAQIASDLLMEVGLRYLDWNVCKDGYRRTDVEPYLDSDEMLCAGRIDGGFDTCMGDSGGPFMCQRCSSCNWYLVGVTSFGPEDCGTSGQPGVYANVQYYEDWIKKHVTSGLSNDKFTCI